MNYENHADLNGNNYNNHYYKVLQEKKNPQDLSSMDSEPQYFITCGHEVILVSAQFCILELCSQSLVTF